MAAMPELPEVERVRRGLESALLGRRVERVRVFRRDVIARPSDPWGGFARARSNPAPGSRRVPAAELLGGQAVVEIRRHGKQLALIGDAGGSVLIHLGMTGQVLVTPPRVRLSSSDHVHVAWHLEGGGRVVFRDPRRFGGVWTCPTTEVLASRWALLGPDALTARETDLATRAGGSSRAVKAALLDQRVLAGVGNIYSDESLHAAGIHPERACRTLSAECWSVLARAIRSVLEAAIEAGGSTLQDGMFTDSAGVAGTFQARHNVYGRAGNVCRSCGQTLSSAIVAQRTTVWCPDCQPRGLSTTCSH